jgi:hypothetical protein
MRRGGAYQYLLRIQMRLSLPAHLSCHGFLLVVFGANGMVNVMPELVEENLAEEDVPQEWVRSGTPSNPRMILSTRSSMYGKEPPELRW